MAVKGLIMFILYTVTRLEKKNQQNTESLLSMNNIEIYLGDMRGEQLGLWRYTRLSRRDGRIADLNTLNVIDKIFFYV